MALLLDKCGDEVYITEDVFKAAAGTALRFGHVVLLSKMAAHPLSKRLQGIATWSADESRFRRVEAQTKDVKALPFCGRRDAWLHAGMFLVVGR
ncbi:hypothetical protein ColLi_13893 [Colletotrichum liriopes]|uniref:Uncharacterized protein n=1 Tax=Colletotrichum liriopes TaxID=708192 RepID=A0AA37H140_9PEZI|nr:hypothetical protein ColLi_13893 [Colletotrichum liriopes]